MTDRKVYGRAETALRDAFTRLKARNPQRLPRTTLVSQNNVAREAGLDPSALKKKRFPELVAEIQHWLIENPDAPAPSSRETLLARRTKARDLRTQIKDLTEQRDKVSAQLVDADARILELTIENARLSALAPKGKVIPIK